MNTKAMRPMVASLLLAIAIACSNVASVASFTTQASQKGTRNKAKIPEFPAYKYKNSPWISTSCSNHGALQMAANDEERTKSSKIDGSVGGTYFLAAVLLVNVWLFSIPTEFRRAHLYPEGNAGLYSDPKGITAEDWAAGVAQYYANGGGVKFDFSIEGRE